MAVAQRLVEWHDGLSVGIEEIDEQHRILVDLLNELNQALIDGRSGTACRDILDRLAQYTRIHFTTEESLMRLLHYPQYERHQQEHQRLLDEMKNLQGELDRGELITFELMEFLKNWLTKHIAEVDRRYTGHFLQQGIKPQLAKPSWRQRVFGAWGH